MKTTKKTTRKDIKFNGSEKAKIRDYIMDHAGQGENYLEFYGNGESYRLAKSLGINVLSIDDGRDFDNLDKLKKELRGKEKMLIGLKDLCNLKMKRLNDVIWLDYCGSWSNENAETMKSLPNIMADKGTVFITLLCGRENYLPKGTKREIIDAATIALIKHDFKVAGIKVKKFFSKSYISKPKYNERKKKGGTRMIVHGLTWEKITTCKK